MDVLHDSLGLLMLLTQLVSRENQGSAARTIRVDELMYYLLPASLIALGAGPGAATDASTALFVSAAGRAHGG